MNLVLILKNCPKGTELYSTVYGKVYLYAIKPGRVYPIICSYHPDAPGEASFTEDGKFSIRGEECVLFPSKENRDWSTFKAPQSISVDDYVKFLAPNKAGQLTYKFGRVVEQISNEDLIIDMLDGTKIHHKGVAVKIDKFNDNLLYPGMLVLCRSDNYCEWTLCMFSHIKDDCYIANQAPWSYCVPYNTNTDHFLGTKENVPEFYQQ